MEVNFDGFPLGGVNPPAFDPADPAGSATFTQDITVFDSLGTPRQVTMYFNRVSDIEWGWNLMADSDEVVSGDTNPETVIASGLLTFDTSGDLVTEARNDPPGPINFVGAAPDQVINLSFTGSSNRSLSRAPNQDNSSVNSLSQDGFPSGNYVGMQVQDNGTIVGEYDNGQQVTVGRLALADFANQTGLSRVGASIFLATPDSGEAVVGFAGAGGRGTLQGNQLEQSNVDLSEEFVKLITDQRGYQAQSRTITTADELLSETVNLKR